MEQCFTDLICCWVCLLVSDLLPVVAAQVCPEGKFWNSQIDDCDDCSTICKPDIPAYMQACQRRCPTVFADLTRTTSTTTATPLITTSLASITAALANVTNRSEDGPVAEGDLSGELPMPVWLIVTIGTIAGIFVIVVVTICIKMNKSDKSSEPSGTTTSTREDGITSSTSVSLSIEADRASEGNIRASNDSVSSSDPEAGNRLHPAVNH